MPNYGYHLARAHGRFNQAVYESLLPMISRQRIRCHREIPVDVFSYSGQRRLAEQVASIRSFLKHAGRPRRFVVVSDGSHRAADIELLKGIDESIDVESVPPPPADIPARFDSYLRNHPTGKQLALIMSLPRERPAFYADSDVLFFASAQDIPRGLDHQSVPAFYLADCGFAGDKRLLRSETERANPVNTGTLLLKKTMDWSLGISRFLEMDGTPNFFTNQTITHLVMHHNGAMAFDPGKYVLQLDDQFIYPDRYAGPELVLRHYVDPVLHKFWSSLNRS
jgi:hypothetical protein